MNNDNAGNPGQIQHVNILTNEKDLHRFQSYLNTASSIIKSYHGREPFHLFLKTYFSLYRKHGSRDRKMISSLCYGFFRTGFGVSSQIKLEEKILLGVFLCNESDSPLLGLFMPGLNAAISLNPDRKFLLLKEKFDINTLFPFMDELSDKISSQPFVHSLLTQPKLFIRIRPRYKESVIEKLHKEQIGFEQISNHCLAFTNNEKIAKILEIDKEAVVQDHNSQRTLELLTQVIPELAGPASIWDCCAGSGGKSILAYDTLKDLQLTVTDKRKQILANLEERFKKAGVKGYRIYAADLEKSKFPVKQLFDVIIADVPCSGSGTWARTPEQLAFFNEKKIKDYVHIQRRIVKNILPNLLPNGYLLYITCSVFKKENEDNIDEFQKKYNLKTVAIQYFKGYEMQSDTMFTALLKKEN